MGGSPKHEEEDMKKEDMNEHDKIVKEHLESAESCSSLSSPMAVKSLCHAIELLQDQIGGLRRENERLKEQIKADPDIKYEKKYDSIPYLGYQLNFGSGSPMPSDQKAFITALNIGHTLNKIKREER